MKHERWFVFFLFLALLSFNISAQNKIKKDNYIGKTYFLKNSLIFLGYSQTPRISPNNIEFVNSDNSLDGNVFGVYAAKILNRTEKIEIKDIIEEKHIAKVFLKAKNGVYQVYLSNRSIKDFKKSFRLAFSEKDFEIPYCKSIKTKEKLFKCYGFPVYVSKESGVESYFYFLEFVPEACGSFDGCWIKVTKKGLDLSGYI